MITHRTPAQSRTPDRLGLPPPLALDLTDMSRPAGWVRGDEIGFRGSVTGVEAAHAACVAHRGLVRRLARHDRERPIPAGTERISLVRRGDIEVVLASDRPIATLLRPAADGATDAARRVSAPCARRR
jgi:hypothetical protein